MEKLFSWGGGKIVEIEIPEWQDWVPILIEQFSQNFDKVKKSHKIGGRWENLYLDIDEVPECRTPIRLARDIGQEMMGISSVILFEPLDAQVNSYPPFWFNQANPGDSTGLHDHAHLSALSGVVYLSCEANAGNLYFHKEGEVDLEIMPSLGKLVLFEPWMRHGVRENRSDQIRLSMAFNLFPFPLPAQSF